MSISILITNFNSWDLAARCIAACGAVDGENVHEIVVVDDHSDAEPPAEWPTHVRLIRNESNLGFGATLNRGIKECKGASVIIMDADAYPQTPFVATIERLFESDASLGVIGFRTVGSDGSGTPSADLEPRGISLVYGQRIDAILERTFPRSNANTYVFACSMAIRREAFDTVGGFDASLKWLDVDIDFCMRVLRSGFRVVSSSDATFFHEGGGTPIPSAARTVEFYKSRWHLVRKHGLVKHPRIALAILRGRLRLEMWICLGLSAFPKRRTLRSAQADARRQLLRHFGSTPS